MAKTKTTTKAKKATPTPPATTPDKRTMGPHELVLSPTVQCAIGMDVWGKFAGKMDLSELVGDLRERVEKVQGGDMRSVEAMLYGQAMTLQTIFTSLARRAAANEGLVQFQTNLTLALKAQAQCRATLEALAEIKAPRPFAYVKQANITSGPQQVNNGTASVSSAVSTENASVRAGAQAHARENASQQNELLEDHRGGGLERRGIEGVRGGIPEHAGAGPRR